MPPSQPSPTAEMKLKPLTLIVATTSSLNTPLKGTPLGIGLAGTLPWPRIKTDMSFFARVTTRPPSDAPGSTNAMIMGRKTYDSVPAGLRPLGKRLSVVLSRGEGGSGMGERVRGDLERKLAKEREREEGQGQEGKGKQTSAMISTSLSAALDSLDDRSCTPQRQLPHPLGHIYIIGGAEIYASALKLPPSQPLRIVMTNVEKLDPDEKFECDTFFPVDGEELENGGAWRRVSAEEVTGWVGEEVTGEWKEEGDVRVRMVGYERVN